MGSLPSTGHSSVRAVHQETPGGVNSIRLVDTAAPQPGPLQAVVQVHAAGITRGELEWSEARLPAVPCYEFSGTVVEPGADAGMSGKVGDPVYGLTPFDRDGVAAEYAAVAARLLVPRPRSLTHVEAAAVPLAALSAHQALVRHGRIGRGQEVLVLGGAGGVGSFVVQLARRRGARVTACTSRVRADDAASLGADHVIEREQFGAAPVGPFDLVVDTTGGKLLERAIGTVRRGGRVVSVAEEPPVELCRRHQVEGAYFVVEPDTRRLGELAQAFDEGELRVLVDRVFPLQEARRAFEHASRSGRGKTVIRFPADEAEG